MDPQIQQLIDLQRVDLAIQGKRDTIASIPGAIAQVEMQARKLEEDLQGRRQGLEEAQKERRRVEGEVDLVKEKLSRYQEQLMQVKTNETYRVLLKEIDTAKAEIAEREERILENMLLADDLSEQLGAGEKEFEALRHRLDLEKAELERGRGEAEARQRVLEGQREQLAAFLSAPTLATYQSVATMRGGVAVAAARDELCLGCRVKLRPQVFQEIRRGVLRQCDTCSRFLHFTEGTGDRPEPRAPEPDPPGTGASSPDDPSG